MVGTVLERYGPVVQLLEFVLGQRSRLVPTTALGVEEYVGEGDVGVVDIALAIGLEIRLDGFLAQACGVAGEPFGKISEFLNETAANDVVVAVQSQGQGFPVENFLPGRLVDQVGCFAWRHVVEKELELFPVEGHRLVLKERQQGFPVDDDVLLVSLLTGELVKQVQAEAQQQKVK